MRTPLLHASRPQLQSNQRLPFQQRPADHRTWQRRRESGPNGIGTRCKIQGWQSSAPNACATRRSWHRPLAIYRWPRLRLNIRRRVRRCVTPCGPGAQHPGTQWPMAAQTCSLQHFAQDRDRTRGLGPFRPHESRGAAIQRDWDALPAPTLGPPEFFQSPAAASLQECLVWAPSQRDPTVGGSSTTVRTRRPRLGRLAWYRTLLPWRRRTSGAPSP
mmetsp:Transcript_33223/g.100393  ORF Transcript_33223/g.100393 Transcript_33223/m.100393 type:complete len:216 (-) Transcript_33223:489-1136(-)